MNIKKNKESIHFTIDKNINDNFNHYIKDKCVNRSLLLQTLIENFLKKNNYN